MKLKIKIKLFSGAVLPEIINKGEWVDLRCVETTTLKGPQQSVTHKSTSNKPVEVKFSSTLIRLGVAMQLPKGFEAHILPRSSTYKNFGIILDNSMGIIDNSYCGNEDEWKFNAIAFSNTQIVKDSRICQFRIELSQKASILNKIKWLFTSGIEFIQVDSLDDNNRNGFGSTGIK